MTPTLTTARLRLTPFRPGDAELLNRWAADPVLCHYGDDCPADPETIEQTRAYVEKVIAGADDSIRRWAVRRITDDRLIGYCMAAFIDRHNRRCKAGLTIGDQESWGLGYGREVLDALVRHCFEDLGLNRIGAEIFAFNERSIRLFEGAGFRREGTVRQSVLKDGRYRDEHLYGLLREEWNGAPPCVDSKSNT
ncbi:MAG: GNAT family N-acetyltransferase [Candidatus Edwardsbacteria bacterium]|jgi:RimJ/RimL family protein N-acetyltransferase|nr:GNAT family N-acetyltransferase [Candidatus Edwardsbacteria bacterium]